MHFLEVQERENTTNIYINAFNSTKIFFWQAVRYFKYYSHGEKGVISLKFLLYFQLSLCGEIIGMIFYYLLYTFQTQHVLILKPEKWRYDKHSNFT